MRFAATLALVAAASALVCAAPAPYTAVGDASADHIASLPGLTTAINFKQYGGYLNVDAQRGRNLYYWYTTPDTTSANFQSANNTLILWLNGGPGCSSVSGFFSENGPFLVQSDGLTIQLNPHAWNNAGHVFWLESPAGVGFSYSDTKADYNTNDDKTAVDSYTALQVFYTRFPELRSKALYITGESYAGHYIPQLAQQILAHNTAGDQPFINLVGIAVGNGLTNEDDDFAAPITFFRHHSIVSPQAYAKANTACQGNFVSNAPGCQSAVNSALAVISDLIDQYDVIEDVCLDDSPENRAKLLPTRRARQSTMLLKNHPHFGEMPITPPCVDNYITTYLNRAEVKDAIHAKGSISWEECTDSINYTFNHSSILPVYEQFFNNYKNLSILIYSGDADGVLPFIGTEGWLARLPLTITEAWREWKGSDLQNAGYTIKYDKLTYLTIRGAGHMVPEFRPMHALDFITRFINKQPF
ncbi:cre [Capsaspora owczarzaki ATCC 30864]|uniref:Carboxypeptidase n=1 Tax=Capsaspora owczarzaki (strain ATCC 30864) TaxID=595528 RepID=A0A0D2ULJ1_CAPO3|nr:cre [Capsaspora owczarzaki ATCC 30864]KJE95976.1 cre [Capsaspora owczarzaki ATCC 30864]|eukprot:XP_004345103.1 cre [Capsaspora owczarzaki ATCC 30864]